MWLFSQAGVYSIRGDSITGSAWSRPQKNGTRCDWQQVRRMREEMPDDVCSTQAWYQNCDALDRELRAQYPMIGALETAVRAYGYAMENSTHPRVQETMRWRLTLDQFGILAQVLARHGLIADVREALEYFAEAK